MAFKSRIKVVRVTDADKLESIANGLLAEGWQLIPHPFVFNEEICLIFVQQF